MTPSPAMTFSEVLKHHLELAERIGLEGQLLNGNQSHAPKWHAFSVINHIRRVVRIAERLCEAGAVEQTLITAAAWHDIGKVIAVQFRPDGPKFHGHAEDGAAYLDKAGCFPSDVVSAIRHHGSLRSLHDPALDPAAGTLWPWLELCDELGKWTISEFPPTGSERTRVQRADLLRKIAVRGVPIRWVNFAERVSSREGRDL